jgi:hypothetical protein
MAEESAQPREEQALATQATSDREKVPNATQSNAENGDDGE